MSSAKLGALGVNHKAGLNGTVSLRWSKLGASTSPSFLPFSLRDSHPSLPAPSRSQPGGRADKVKFKTAEEEMEVREREGAGSDGREKLVVRLEVSDE